MVNKLVKKNITYIFLIVLYVILFTIQINLKPFERYCEWDHFWVDVRTAGMLVSLKQAVSNFELPCIDPHTGFGWNLAGNFYSFWTPSNFLILIFPPETVIILTQILFLILKFLIWVVALAWLKSQVSSRLILQRLIMPYLRLKADILNYNSG